MLQTSRLDRFEQKGKDTLLPLPARPYEYGAWVLGRKVPSDYHVLDEGVAYSVPLILFDILDDRVGTHSTIVVGQRPYNDWHGFIDDPVIAEAILDWLSRKRYHIKLRGESMRLKEASFDRVR